MKDLFPGHFKEDEGQLREIWGTSLFVFDANILLNLYRYSDTTRKEFLRILEKIKDRVWLPHRAAEEYLSNRLSVIDQQEKSYEETAKSIKALRSDLENTRQHPFVGQAIMAKVSVIFDELCVELDKNKLIHTTRIYNDEIKEAVACIFENRVGLPYEKSRLEQLMIEGEERYRQKIPPGFKDASKSGDSEVFAEKCKKYGDLIVWTQVIDKAIESGKGVVLVTDDRKEDWWEKFKGKTIGPHPELVKEFKGRANNTFYMYQADRFLELARENLGEQVSDEIVEEVREVRRLERVAQKRQKDIEHLKRRKVELDKLLEDIERSRHQLMAYEEERYMLQQHMHKLDSTRDEMKHHAEYLMREGRENPEFESFMRRYAALSEEYVQVKNSLEHSFNKINAAHLRVMELEREAAHQMGGMGQESAASS